MSRHTNMKKILYCEMDEDIDDGQPDCNVLFI
jgi:hypothetical protein